MTPYWKLAVSLLAQLACVNALAQQPSGRELARIQTLVGLTLWSYDHDACRGKRSFTQQIASGPEAVSSRAPTFPFTIEGIVNTAGGVPYLKVRLGKGDVAYIAGYEVHPADSTSSEGRKYGCFLNVGPEEVAKQTLENLKEVESLSVQRDIDLAAERRLAEEVSRRPGVKIGMTAAQVITKTNWGAPESVNKTTTRNGVREQWVYGGGNYLYFENGRLTAIQN